MKTKTYALSMAVFLGLSTWIDTAQAQDMTVVLEDAAWDRKKLTASCSKKNKFQNPKEKYVV